MKHPTPLRNGSTGVKRHRDHTSFMPAYRLLLFGFLHLRFLCRLTLFVLSLFRDLTAPLLRINTSKMI